MANIVVVPKTLEFGAIVSGTIGGQMAYVDSCPAAVAVTATVVDGSAYFSVARLVVSYRHTQAVDPSELPPRHSRVPPVPRPAAPHSKHPPPGPPTEQVLVERAENDGSGPLATKADDVLSVYVAAKVPDDAVGGAIQGTISIAGDGQELARLPLHAFVGGVILQINTPPLSVRQGESLVISMSVTSKGGPDTDVSVELHPNEYFAMQSPTIHLATGSSQSFAATISARADCGLGANDLWAIASAFGGRQSAYDSRGRFLGVPFTIDVLPAKLTVEVADLSGVHALIPINEGGRAAIPVNVWIGSGDGQVDVGFSGGRSPAGLTVSPSQQWISVVNNKDTLPNHPANNVDKNGMARGTITVSVAPGFLNGDPERDEEVWLNWEGYAGTQTGQVSAGLAVFSPTAKMTDFDPIVHGYSFSNHWMLTNQDSETIRNYFGNALDDVMSVCDALIAASLIGVAGITISAVVEEVSPALRNQIHDAILSADPGVVGLCGGMAFSSLDFHRALMALPTDGRADTQPGTGPLRDYIWQRLLDSLGANGPRFMEYLVTLHILPGLVGGALGAIVGAATGASVGVASGIAAGGAAGGPVGGVIGGVIGGIAGAFAGGDTIVIDLGGSKKLMQWSREEWAKLKAHLDKNEAWPIGLVANTPNPFESHQIVAVGYDDGGGGNHIRLYVYDNNSPKVRKTISMDLGGDTMQSTTDITGDNGGPAPWMPLQGIICEAYVAKRPPTLV